MRKPFTLRVDENLIGDIKVKSIKKGYKNYADYIEDLLVKALALETLEDDKKENKDYSLLDDETLILINSEITSIKSKYNICPF